MVPPSPAVEHCATRSAGRPYPFRRILPRETSAAATGTPYASSTSPEVRRPNSRPNSRLPTISVPSHRQSTNQRSGGFTSSANSWEAQSVCVRNASAKKSVTPDLPTTLDESSSQQFTMPAVPHAKVLTNLRVRNFASGPRKPNEAGRRSRRRRAERPRQRDSRCAAKSRYRPRESGESRHARRWRWAG